MKKKIDQQREIFRIDYWSRPHIRKWIVGDFFCAQKTTQNPQVKSEKMRNSMYACNQWLFSFINGVASFAARVKFVSFTRNPLYAQTHYYKLIIFCVWLSLFLLLNYQLTCVCVRDIKEVVTNFARFSDSVYMCVCVRACDSQSLWLKIFAVVPQ